MQGTEEVGEVVDWDVASAVEDHGVKGWVCWGGLDRGFVVFLLDLMVVGFRIRIRWLDGIWISHPQHRCSGTSGNATNGLMFGT